MKRRKVVWLTVIVLSVLAVLTIARFLKPPGDKRPAFEPVKVVRGDVEITITATGVVLPQNRLEIKPPIPGRVESVLAEEGQEVKKDDVLAWLSSIERAALLDTAKAKGNEEYARWNKYYSPTPLLAPLDGTIISRSVEPGQTVTTMNTVLVISDRLIVKVRVDETDIGQIKIGQRTDFTLDAYPDDNVTGNVDHIAFEAITVNNVTVYEVEVLPDKVPSHMKSGMTADVTFTVAARKDVLVLPVRAVLERDGHSEVYVRRGSEQMPPPRVRIEKGLSDGKVVEILSGLTENDTVLVPSFDLPSSSRLTRRNPFLPKSPQGMQPGAGGR